MDIFNEIQAATELLGYPEPPTVIMISPGRYDVSINDEYFGIWDADQHTFVD